MVIVRSRLASTTDDIARGANQATPRVRRSLSREPHSRRRTWCARASGWRRYPVHAPGKGTIRRHRQAKIVVGGAGRSWRSATEELSTVTNVFGQPMGARQRKEAQEADPASPTPLGLASIAPPPSCARSPLLHVPRSTLTRRWLYARMHASARPRARARVVTRGRAASRRAAPDHCADKMR